VSEWSTVATHPDAPLEQTQLHRIVWKVDDTARHALGLVVGTLRGDERLDELGLQLLVGKVDAELLERVDLLWRGGWRWRGSRLRAMVVVVVVVVIVVVLEGEL
jgi:hypothetical protein